jgi:hypothetical protein
MAGRPPLRIGQHGKITRKNLGGGVWMARTRFRDNDGVTRIVERRGPADYYDKHGKLAEDALIEALVQRRAAGDNEITLDTRIMSLIDQHIDRTAAPSAQSTRTATAQGCWARSSQGSGWERRRRPESTPLSARCGGHTAT